MENVAKLIRQFVANHVSITQFLDRLEELKTRNMVNTRRWWASPPAFEAYWNDLGGFDEREYESRVRDVFSQGYRGVIRASLSPVVSRKVAATPEIQVMLSKIRDFLFSDVHDKALRAETVEEVYHLLGDDQIHWLVVYLVDYLRAAERKHGRVA